MPVDAENLVRALYKIRPQLVELSKTLDSPQARKVEKILRELDEAVMTNVDGEEPKERLN
jgi:hypothetical protein